MNLNHPLSQEDLVWWIDLPDLSDLVKFISRRAFHGTENPLTRTWDLLGQNKGWCPIPVQQAGPSLQELVLPAEKQEKQRAHGA